MGESKDSHVSTENETKGFDLSAGKTWIYPENFPLRNYQFNIVQTALYNNTLVCLPTGLGKTFIAAVIMYNFWRWYPRGKVVFLAPTKPLVAQQIYACHNIMGIPSTETTELTGAVSKKNREIAWLQKRVIFATPQVFQNDLNDNIVPNELVKCVVIDEAHKALGKHSYCECIRTLSTHNPYFRILALSATPGNKLDNVHEIIQNLHISNIELRDESSPDIIPYINQRKINTVVVPLGDELTRYKHRYISIMDRHVRLLTQFNILNAQTANISKGKIFITLQQFQGKPDKSGNYGTIIKTLNILLTMYHAFELLVRHGLRAFYKFYQNHSDKFWINSEHQLLELLEEINQYLGPFPEIQLYSKKIPEIPDNLIFGHNKFHKLKELLLEHFENARESNSDTRAIVFVEYRDIVSELYILLLQSRPLIRPQMFVGQAGQTQKQQMEALEAFRLNHVNVLISTSIGEEGLDVGEVDLIICFDVPQRNPTRFVQRMGRTGRKRDGHVILLVTEGKESDTLKSTIARRDSLNNKILNTSNIHASLYDNNPRMIPKQFNPICHKIVINIQPKTPAVKEKKQKKKQKDANTKTKESNAKTKNAKSNTESKGENQVSMTKFLTSKKADNTSADVNKVNKPNMISQHRTENNQTQPMIKPSNIKLLTNDNDALEFLTLCAIKQSESDVHKETEESINKIDTTYMCKAQPIHNIEDFFNFEIPDLKILDCLNTLNINEPEDLPPENNHLETEDLNFQDDAFEDHIWYSNRVPEPSPICDADNSANLGESKFEDLLDDITDSDSDTTQILIDDEVNINLKNYADASTVLPLNNPSNSFNESHDSKNDLKHEVSFMDTGMLDLTEPGIFEDILDESSSDEGTNSVERNSGNVKSENRNNSCYDTAPSKDENLNEKCNKSFIEHSNEISSNKITNWHNSTMKNDDVPFRNKNLLKENLNANLSRISDDRFENSVMCDVATRTDRNNANSSTLRSSHDASMLSITQAIKEIERMNKKKQEEASIKNDIKNAYDDQDNVKSIDYISEEDMFDDMDEEIAEMNIENIQEKKSSEIKLPTETKHELNEIILDDDWNSDFETFEAPTNSTVSKEKENNNTKILQNISNKIEQTNFKIETKSTISKTKEESNINTKESQNTNKSDRWHVAEIKTNSTNLKDKQESNNNAKTLQNINKVMQSFAIETKTIKDPKQKEENNEELKQSFAVEAKPKSTNLNSSKWVNMSFKKNTGPIKHFDSKKGRIAEKLSSMKSLPTPRVNVKTKTSMDTGYDSEDDFVVTSVELEKINLLESTFFQETKKASKSTTSTSSSLQHFANKGILSLKKNEKNVVVPSTSRKYLQELREKKQTNSDESQTSDLISPHNGNFSQIKSDWEIEFADEMDDELNKIETPDLSPKESFMVDQKHVKFAKEDNYKKKDRKKHFKNKFIDDEAEVSSDASTDNESSGEDDDLQDFVSYTQDMTVSEDMRAHYLQTVKSPVKRPGAFLIREPKANYDDVEIYSQAPPPMDDTYLNDSFCVGEDEEELDVSKQAFGYSILERAEKELKKRKRKRRNGSPDGTEQIVNKNKKKMRRVYTLNSSVSSEDDILILS